MTTDGWEQRLADLGQAREAAVRPVGRCIGCFHPFETGPCGGCGAVEQCDGYCHDQGTGDCHRCESGDWQQMCDDCNAYAALDGPT